MSLYEDENKMVIGELWHDEKVEDDPTVDCALCGAEVDEETTTYGICEKCWTDAHTFYNAIMYGKKAKVKVEINGLYAKAFTPEQIDRALVNAMNCIRSSVAGCKFAEQMVQSFLGDDDGDFADWLKEQKNID